MTSQLHTTHLKIVTELRDSCIDCVRKHLAQALVLMQEVHQGYPKHHWIAVGHLGEAADEALKEFPKLAAEIRKHRIKYMADSHYAVPVLDLIEKAKGYVKGEAKMTKKGQTLVSDEISHLMKDGPSKGPQKDKKMPQKQAIAVALDVARRKGMKTPPNPNDEAFEYALTSRKLIQEVGPWKRAHTAYSLARRGGAPVGNAVGHGAIGLAGGADPGKSGTFGKTTRGLRDRRRAQGWNKPSSGSSTPPTPKPPTPPTSTAPGPHQDPLAFDSQEENMSIFDNIVKQESTSLFDGIVENYDDDDGHDEPPPSHFGGPSDPPTGSPEHGKSDSWGSLKPSKPSTPSKNPWPDVKPSEPHSEFDEFDSVGESESMFDAIIEDRVNEDANWNDRVARTMTLADELIKLRSSAK